MCVCVCVCVFSLFVEKLPAHRDYQQCSVPEKQLIMKVSILMIRNQKMF